MSDKCVTDSFILHDPGVRRARRKLRKLARRDAANGTMNPVMIPADTHAAMLDLHRALRATLIPRAGGGL